MGEENPHIFKSIELCDFVGKAKNESQEDDEEEFMEIFLRTMIGLEPCEDGDGEEMKLPKEMVEIEGSLFKSVFKDNEDKQSFGTVMQLEEDEPKV